MTLRSDISIAVLAGVLALSWAPVRSEVYAETDREGRFVRVHTAVARGSEGRVWDSYGAATRGGLVLNPDGDLLVSNGWDETCRIWDPLTGRLVLTQEGTGEHGARTVAHVHLDAEGTRLRGRSRQHAICADVQAGRERIERRR